MDRHLELSCMNSIHISGLALVAQRFIEEKGLGRENTLIINGSTARYMSLVAQSLRNLSRDSPQIGILYVTAKTIINPRVQILDSRVNMVERFARDERLRVTIKGLPLCDYSDENSEILPWHHPARTSKPFSPQRFDDLIF